MGSSTLCWFAKPSIKVEERFHDAESKHCTKTKGLYSSPYLVFGVVIGL